MAAESSATLWIGFELGAPHLLQCQGGNWNLTFLALPVMGLIGDFSMLLELDLIKGELLNGVIVLTRVLSVVTVVH